MSTYLETPYHGIPFKTPSRNKLLKSRAFNDENNASVYPQTVKKSGRKPHTPGRLLATGHKTVARRLNSHKGVVGLNPLSEITNKTPHPKKTNEISISKSFELPDILNVESEASHFTRRLSSTRKTSHPLSSASKCFKTPISGNPWDVSDGSIEVAQVDELVQFEDDDDVEYCPPTALEPDHGINLEFPDYTIGRDLFNGLTSDEIPHRTYQVDLTTEVYELELPSLVDEIDILIPEMLHKKDQVVGYKEGVAFPVNNNWRRIKSKATTGHSRIPSLSKQYHASARDSTPAKQPASMDLRSNQTNGSNMRIQSLRTGPLISQMTIGLRKPEQIRRLKPANVVTESIFNDSPPQIEDVFFEL